MSPAGIQWLGLDDPVIARTVAERFACDHHEIVVEPEVARLLPELAIRWRQSNLDTGSAHSLYPARYIWHGVRHFSVEGAGMVDSREFMFSGLQKSATPPGLARGMKFAKPA